MTREQAIGVIVAVASEWLDNALDGLVCGGELEADWTDEQIRERVLGDYFDIEQAIQARDVLAALTFLNGGEG